MKHWFHSEARHELLESVRYYESQQSGLGGRFLAAVANAIRQIQTHSSMYREVGDSWRQCRVARFPFGIIYRVRNQRIEIIAVMHLHRRPGYWQDRTAKR